MPSPSQDIFRKLPSVEAVLQDEQIERSAAGVPRRIVVECVREAIDHMRGQLLKQACGGLDPAAIRQFILAEAQQALRAATARHYRRAINATGIILHTALGARPCLPPPSGRSARS